jgi:outer membrane protein TolC
VPLFTAGVVEADVRAALSRLREARDRLCLAERSVRREVEDAWTGFEAARRRIDEVRVRLDAARRAVEQADGLWTAGLATNLERLTAQDEELSAELDLAGAEIARKVSYLDLRRAAGSLHELIGLDRTGIAAAEGQRARAR